MKWRIAVETPEGSGTFESTGEVFDDGFETWDGWDNAPIQGRLSDLNASDGRIYQATWVQP